MKAKQKFCFIGGGNRIEKNNTEKQTKQNQQLK
jgi:hypothetical protein